MDWPVLARLIPYERYMIAMVPPLIAVPLLLFGGDGSRFLHLAWIGSAIAVAYFLWLPDDGSMQKADGPDMRKSSSGAPVGKSSLTSGVVTAFVAVWAYTYAGAPLIAFERVQDTCNLCQDTTYWLNKNPLGEWLSQAMYDVQALRNFSFHMDGQKLYNKATLLYPSENDALAYSRENGGFWISGDFAGRQIFDWNFPVQGGQNIMVALDYEGRMSSVPELRVNHHSIPASHADADKIIWMFPGPSKSDILYFDIFSTSRQDYTVTSLSITMEDRASDID